MHTLDYELLPAFLLSAMAAGVIGLILYARWNYGTLEDTGIPVVKPWPLFGSDPFFYQKNVQKQDEGWVATYGGIFGVYEGRTPTIYVSNPDLIRQIFVRDAAKHFCERKSRPGSGNDIVDEFLDFLPREKWKIGRSAITPLFTPSHVQHMGHVMSQVMRKYLNGNENYEDLINLKEFIGPPLAEMILKCMFGVNPEDQQVAVAVELLRANSFEPPPKQRFEATLFLTFPFLRKYFGNNTGVERFEAMLDEILSCSGGSQNTKLVETLHEMLGRLDTSEFRLVNVTKATVYSLGFGMFVAGFDTTTLVVALCAYHLTMNREAYEKCVQEVREDGPEATPYLNACIQETLRLHPPFPRSEICCTEEWNCNGYKISPGTLVKMLCCIANRNPQVYDRPDEFVPERFLHHRQEQQQLNPYAFTSFGFGPRNCAGMKLGLVLPKVILREVLRKFEMRAGTTKLQLGNGCSNFLRFEPINVLLTRRK